ncbi:MAG: hypothetical protein HY089_02650 [Ignavibacteriales bacterium]|nr:hypothetical protein [Ignavibacteriales bacterium]
MNQYHMLRAGRLCFVIFLFTLFSFVGFSQELDRFAKKGALELGGNITFTSNTYISNGQNWLTYKVFSVMPYIGYFVADGVEIGFNPLGITAAGFTGNGTTTQLRMLVAPSYNFTLEGNVFPFVEALFGYTATSNSGGSSGLDGFSWGGRGGLKCIVTEKALLNIGAQYLEITTNSSGASSRTGTNEFSFSAGFTIWL